MAHQHPLPGFLNDKGFDTEVEDRAKRAAAARLTAEDQDNLKRNQSSVATTVAPVKKQPTTITSTVSKPKSKAEHLQTTATRSNAARSFARRSEKMLTSAGKTSANPIKQEPEDYSFDDTVHSDLMDSPLDAKSGARNQMPSRAVGRPTPVFDNKLNGSNSHFAPETPVNAELEFYAMERQMNGEYDDSGDEDDDDEEDDEEEAENEPVTQVLVNTSNGRAFQHPKLAVSHPTTVQRPISERPTAGIFPVNPSGSKLSQSSSNPFSNPARFAFPVPLPSDQRVQFAPVSPTQNHPNALQPVGHGQAPSTPHSAKKGSKRARSALTDQGPIQHLADYGIVSQNGNFTGLRHATSNPNTNKEVRHSKAAELELLDYSTEALGKKKFTDLQQEPFDHNPQRPKLELPVELEGSLVERLAQVQELDADCQTKFFNSLPLQEWEDAGDWFLERFSSILQRTREARKAKRQVAAEFEKQVAARHEAVEARIRGTAQTMEEMKRSGQVVLQANIGSRLGSVVEEE
jgi:hypothetical protein